MLTTAESETPVSASPPAAPQVITRLVHAGRGNARDRVDFIVVPPETPEDIARAALILAATSDDLRVSTWQGEGGT